MSGRVDVRGVDMWVGEEMGRDGSEQGYWDLQKGRRWTGVAHEEGANIDCP